jgi:lipid-A-disaccharide synthase
MAQMIDHVLALFPFEPPYMEAAGMVCDFVGHPVVAEPVASDADAMAFRERHGIGNAPCLLVLPGSRRGEVGRLAPIFSEALRPVLTAQPEIRVVLPAASPVAALVAELTRDWPGAPIILDPRGQTVEAEATERRAAFRAANLALAASGTVSLELAAAGTPMVIAYDMNWLSRQLVTRMLQVDTVTLVNLVSDTRVVPEFLGENCNPKAIATALLQVMAEPEKQKDAMALTMQRLGQGGEAPGLRAARAVLDRRR